MKWAITLEFKTEKSQYSDNKRFHIKTHYAKLGEESDLQWETLIQKVIPQHGAISVHWA